MQQLKTHLYVLCSRMEHVKENMLNTLRHDKELALMLKNNSCTALEDLTTGRVFNDDKAAENLRSSIEDIMKLSGIAAVFVLPGGSVGLVVLRKLLQTDIAAKAHIENLLTLSVEQHVL